MTNYVEGIPQLKLRTRVRDITGNNFDNTKTAFIGSIGNHENVDLFLVMWSGVVLAKNPRKHWSSASVSIHQWVDVDIIIKGENTND